MGPGSVYMPYECNRVTLPHCSPGRVVPERAAVLESKDIPRFENFEEYTAQENMSNLDRSRHPPQDQSPVLESGVGPGTPGPRPVGRARGRDN